MLLRILITWRSTILSDICVTSNTTNQHQCLIQLNSQYTTSPQKRIYMLHCSYMGYQYILSGIQYPPSYEKVKGKRKGTFEPFNHHYNQRSLQLPFFFFLSFFPLSHGKKSEYLDHTHWHAYFKDLILKHLHT